MHKATKSAGHQQACICCCYHLLSMSTGQLLSCVTCQVLICHWLCQALVTTIAWLRLVSESCTS